MYVLPPARELATWCQAVLHDSLSFSTRAACGVFNVRLRLEGIGSARG